MISNSEWLITVVALGAVILFDLTLAILRRHKETTVKEAATWTLIYVGLAIVFGVLLPNWASNQAREEFFAGWLTEYSLSVDNIFIFVIILAKLRIEKEKQQLALLYGILIAIVLRVILISIGAAVIAKFAWVFFIFGAFLLYTAWHLFIENDEDKEWKENKLITKLRARGASSFTIALVALGVTDLIFALDSIPAIFGLTQNVYVVITANIFALMGLRQLYFLIGGLMSRLIYLGKGLSIILAFIGVKLLFEAFHGISIHEIAGVKIPHISIAVSLTFIVTTLVLTTIISLVASKKKQSNN
jgi:tellurite resistance protein TerC